MTFAPLAVWALFLLIYLSFAGSLSVDEIFAGTVISAGITILVFRLKRTFGRRLAFRWDWLPTLWRVVPAMFSETAQLYGALFRRLSGKHEEGRFLEYPYPVRPGDPLAAVRFGMMAFGVCVTPNSYLVSIDSRAGKVVLRQLVGNRISPTDRAYLDLP